MGEKNTFKMPYSGIDKNTAYHLLVGASGECSIIMKIINPVTRYSAASSAYQEFHGLMTNIVKILGDGYLLQKQDVISKSKYPLKPAAEYLQGKYNAHFAGRDFIKVDTYLTITLQVRKGAFYVYDPKALTDFLQSVGKVLDILKAGKTEPLVLQAREINLLVMQVLSLNFSGGAVTLNNLSPDDTGISMGDRMIRSINLINIDNIDLPQQVGTHIELNEKETLRGFPVDFLSFLFKVPDFEVILFNQVIEIPDQLMTLKKLELKKKRHSGIPDPANTLCMEDIDQLLTDVARDNQLLVNCHFNILVTANKAHIQKATNFVESALFGLGIVPSKNAYNQLELFRMDIPMILTPLRQSKVTPLS